MTDLEDILESAGVFDMEALHFLYVLIQGRKSCSKCGMPEHLHNEHDYIRCYLK